MAIGIRDIASRTGVSTATVSRALRGLPNVSAETRALVERVALELGYVPSPSAAGLASGRHQAVAAIVPTLNRWFNTAVLEGADRVLRQHQYDVFLVNLGIRDGDRERVFHNALLRRRADAVIGLGIGFSAEERRELRTLATPCIVVGGPVRGVCDVGIDERDTARKAMAHLLELGHTRIGHIGADRAYMLNPQVAVARRQAWEEGLRGAGLPVRQDWFASGDFLLPQSRVAALAVLSGPDRPTAVFAGSDEMAFGTILAAHELGLRVPEDLSVIGIDDHDHAEAFGLTTMHQDPVDHGEVAATLLLDLLEGRRSRLKSIRQPSTLVVRRSTAPPAAADVRPRAAGLAEA